MPRAGLAPAAVIAAGAELADEVGLAGLTMGLLAERVGVRTPSLYKHVDSLDALRRSIGLQAKREMGDALARACVGRSGADAVHAFADAWRRWVVAHPGRYAATVRAPAPDDEEGLLLADEVLQILFAVLSGFGLEGPRAIDAARMVRSALHGFASLESDGGFGFPRDIDRSYHYLVTTLIAGLRSPDPDPDA
ncbi:TetR-like C-terminal domain-containing protein [Catenuloplanes japonicus]|uniref:TetR-like C-terminal domain-containing protein n=1 Tax=Catenuloplanes japonicus TaxID=33876 RepID=UPI000525F999|nr:TetR-like C-terminal domain-containing protein [Catenuloplanes japonicus]